MASAYLIDPETSDPLYGKAIIAADKCWESPESSFAGHRAYIAAFGAYRDGNYEKAARFLNQTRTIGRSQYDKAIVTNLLSAMIAFKEGNHDKAQQWFDKAERRLRPPALPRHELRDAASIFRFELMTLSTGCSTKKQER